MSDNPYRQLAEKIQALVDEMDSELTNFECMTDELRLRVCPYEEDGDTIFGDLYVDLFRFDDDYNYTRYDRLKLKDALLEYLCEEEFSTDAVDVRGNRSLALGLTLSRRLVHRLLRAYEQWEREDVGRTLEELSETTLEEKKD